MSDPALELNAVRAALADLIAWADDRLNEDYDRQYIAEHMADALTALLGGVDPPAAPF